MTFYIKDTEIPSKCEDCPLIKQFDGKTYGCLLTDDRSTFDEINSNIKKNCPLIKIPTFKDRLSMKTHSGYQTRYRYLEDNHDLFAYRDAVADCVNRLRRYEDIFFEEDERVGEKMEGGE